MIVFQFLREQYRWTSQVNWPIPEFSSSEEILQIDRAHSPIKIARGFVPGTEKTLSCAQLAGKNHAAAGKWISDGYFIVCWA